ncbi:MFS transporter [Streptomyces polygonati]|uniref:MFS transporter n=1 Tax=Streptomyces polygonati TaxID=1617087 RepID=A0ABV8I277_9ACTN
MDTTPSSGAPAPQRTMNVHWGKVGALVSGQAMVQGGSYALLIAMNWTAVQIGGASAVSMLMLASTIPRALMLIFGGAVSDLLGPRYVLVRTTAARAAVLIGGAVVAASTQLLWPLMLVALVEGSLLGLAGPASSVLMPQLAAREHLGRANSLYSMVLRLAPIAGAPIGAWLISVGQLWQALLAAAGTGVFWLACLLYVTHGFKPPRRDAGVSLFKRSADGIQLLVRNSRLRWMFLASFCLDLAFGWPADVALPSLVDQRGWGVGAVGVVLAAFSVGALGSSAVGAIMAHRISMFVRLVATGLGLAVGILVMALMPTVLSLTVVAAGVGLLSGLNGPAIVTVYQQSAPESRMGAAMSTLSLSGIGVGPISIAIFSSLALGLGVQTTWLICGTVAFFSPFAALVALRQPVQLGEPGDTDDPAAQAAGQAGAQAAVTASVRSDRPDPDTTPLAAPPATGAPAPADVPEPLPASV